MTTFADLRLSDDILAAVRDVGYDSPSPIQEQAIPPLLEGHDVIGQAQTGSGKTAAFGLPMLQYVDPDEHDVQGLVLTPTRELCIQVTQALRAYGKAKGIDVVAVFGGAPIRSQQAQLRAGGQVVVGTVGRVKDLISRHSLMLHACRFVVLDEADEMLDLGFLEDVERILSLTPSSRQTALFSATMPPEIRRLADQYLYDPVTIKVKTDTLTVDTVEQFALEVSGRDKNEALVKVLEAEHPDQALVFVRTKIRCDQLFRLLRDRGMNVKALHGDMTQGARDGVMISFKDGRLPLLIATDVASRGLDISGISHVINFDVPTSPDVYVHRIGRTGRVGRSGRAITFYEPRQQREIQAIENHAGVKLSPWVKDAQVAPMPVTAPPKRHSKPHVSVTNGEDAPSAKLIVSGGRAAGLEPSDIVHAITSAAELDGEAVRNVRVLEHFAFVEVPAGRRRARHRDRRRDPRARARAGSRAGQRLSLGAAAVSRRHRVRSVSGPAAGPATSGTVACYGTVGPGSSQPWEAIPCVRNSPRCRGPRPPCWWPLTALFVAMGGVGYAAVTVPNNSVGTNQLQHSSVTHSKLRFNSVSFQDIQPQAIGLRRADLNQLQQRVASTCSAGNAIGAIANNGTVTCNAARPAEFGTTGTKPVTTALTSVTSETLPTGSTYLAMANPS